MSHEQKPGKLRLVNSGRPQRRRAGEGGDGAAIPAAVQAELPSHPQRQPAALYAILFVIACAAGGGAGAWLRLADALP